MEGVLSVRRDSETDAKDDDVAQYTFNCESKYKTKLPFAVTIYKDAGQTDCTIFPLTHHYLHFQMLLSTFQSSTLHPMFLNPASIFVFCQNLLLKIPPPG